MDFRFGAGVGKIDPAKNIIGNYCSDIVEDHLHVNLLKCMLGSLWLYRNHLCLRYNFNKQLA
jgi:hypothetical protein